MWVEVLRARWNDPFSTLRHKQFELSLVKDFIVDDQLAQGTISKRRRTQQLGTVTVPMPTEKIEECHDRISSTH